MRHSHLRRLIALGCAVAAVGACESLLDEPTGPSSPSLSETGWSGEQPFYYFRPSRNARDIRIPLDLDPTELMVVTSAPDDALTALTARGLNVVSAKDVPHAGEHHRRITFAPGTSREAVVAAGFALRADSQISFVGHAYTAETGGKMVPWFDSGKASLALRSKGWSTAWVHACYERRCPTRPTPVTG